MENKLLLEQDAVVGFSPSFTFALLKKLKDLVYTKRFIVDVSGSTTRVTEIGKTVLDYLSEQLKVHPGNYETKEDVKKIIALGEEFLGCFYSYKDTEEEKNKFLDSKITKKHFSPSPLKILLEKNMVTFRDLYDYFSKEGAVPIFGVGGSTAAHIKNLFRDYGIELEIAHN